MIRSMTGYGRAKETIHNRDITIELRSVNNRFLDCTVKIPRVYTFCEDVVRAQVQKAITRGKVDVFITIQSVGAEATTVTVNRDLAAGYVRALHGLAEEYGLRDDISVMGVARFPDVLTVSKAEEDMESLSADICTVLQQAIAGYNAMREAEGARLCEAVSYTHLKIAPYLLQMRRNIAQALDIAVDQVNVKGTTEEKLGFTGDGSGMAAHAVCLMEQKQS